MKKNVVYLHVKKGTNDVFYVGIGKSERRAYSKHNRGRHWNNTVNKYGYDVRIVNHSLSISDMELIECDLIYTFGRQAYGEGQLVNVEEGGYNIGSYDRRGTNNPMFGKHFSDKSKAKISKTQKARIAKNGHPMKGKVHPNKGKQIKTNNLLFLDLQTGVYYNRLADLCEAVGFDYNCARNGVNIGLNKYSRILKINEG